MKGRAIDVTKGMHMNEEKEKDGISEHAVEGMHK